ncbi:INO80 complex subunit E isoform X3 [Dasypus novemcinctus]|uniref:INO80 complex subunit E isoform X3 n=1 Tax=Dasypus novemcinctus TaxID=9361 RepID=UPI00265EB155|nr:INO80 complex subunit E isoform X3 [Dasypus novemcinctus]
MNGPADGEVDYKKKYRNLKRKLKFLIYEHECFQEELRKAQRKLLKVSRDKSFLLDRLLQYENVDEDSSGRLEPPPLLTSPPPSQTQMPLHLRITVRQRGHPSYHQIRQLPRAASDPLNCLFSRKRSPPLGGAPSPSSLSLPPSTGFPLQASGAPSPYLSSMAVGPPDCPVGGPLTFPGRGSGTGVGAALAPLPPPKMPPPTILSTVPRQMFSDTGSGDDALDGDDDLVIDIPE